MDLGLDDKTAIVAAASRGLGYAVAYELAEEGARVMICARRPDVLEEARETIERETRGEVHAVAADLATEEGIDKVAEAAERAFGGVDILGNNSGGPPSGPFEQHDWAAWKSAVDLLLRSTVELTRQILPGMRERKWGRILNIT